MGKQCTQIQTKLFFFCLMSHKYSRKLDYFMTLRNGSAELNLNSVQ